MHAPAFGQRTGLSRAMYEALWSCVIFSEQSVPGGTTEKSRWELINDFVALINRHRAARISPSD